MSIRTFPSISLNEIDCSRSTRFAKIFCTFLDPPVNALIMLFFETKPITSPLLFFPFFLCCSSSSNRTTPFSIRISERWSLPRKRMSRIQCKCAYKLFMRYKYMRSFLHCVCVKPSCLLGYTVRTNSPLLTSPFLLLQLRWGLPFQHSHPQQHGA